MKRHVLWFQNQHLWQPIGTKCLCSQRALVRFRVRARVRVRVRARVSTQRALLGFGCGSHLGLPGQG